MHFQRSAITQLFRDNRLTLAQEYILENRETRKKRLSPLHTLPPFTTQKIYNISSTNRFYKSSVNRKPCLRKSQSLLVGMRSATPLGWRSMQHLKSRWITSSENVTQHSWMRLGISMMLYPYSSCLQTYPQLPLFHRRSLLAAKDYAMSLSTISSLADRCASLFFQ